MEFGGGSRAKSKNDTSTSNSRSNSNESKEMDMNEEKYVALTEALRYMRRRVTFWRNKHAEQELRNELPPLSVVTIDEKKEKSISAMRRRVNDLELALSTLQTSTRVISLSDENSKSDVRSRVLRSDTLKLQMSRLKDELNREEVKLRPSLAAVNTFQGTYFRAKTLLRDDDLESKTCLGRVRVPYVGKSSVVSVSVTKSFVRSVRARSARILIIFLSLVLILPHIYLFLKFISQEYHYDHSFI